MSAITEIGEVQEPVDPVTYVRERLHELLARGVPKHRWDDRKKKWIADLWRHEPGALPWWESRQRVGGRIAPTTFRAAVDGLLGDGLLIEAWLSAPGRRTPSHVLLLPGHSKALKRPVVRARAIDEVLAKEPWSAALRSRI